MPELWNKYGPTAARKPGKPGREVRPKSVTVDIHAHVDVPEAAKFVAPHLDLATVPLAHFATPEIEGAHPEAGSRYPRAARPRAPARRSRRHGHRRPDDRAAAAAMLLHGAARYRGEGGADRQRRHRRILRQNPDRFKGFGTVPMPDGSEAAKELERCVKQLGFTGVEVLTNVAGKELSDPAFAPFWKKAEELGVLVMIHPNGFTEASALRALLFQQRHRQSAGDDDRAALSDLRRRAGTASQAEDPRRARRRLSRRLFRPHRSRLGRALGRPRRPAAAADRAISSASMSTPWCSRRISSPNWCACSAPITSCMGTDYPFDMAEYDPVGHIAGVEGFDAATIAALAGGNSKRLSRAVAARHDSRAAPAIRLTRQLFRGGRWRCGACCRRRRRGHLR